MNDTEPPILELRLCPVCGAASPATRPTCWMCQSALPVLAPQGGSQAAAYAQASRFDPIFYVLLFLSIALTILIGIGIAVEDPGALAGYVIVVSPAFLVTGVRALLQVQGGGKPQPVKLLLSFIISFIVTAAVIVLLTVAAAVLLFITCMQALGGG